jgi:pimeloyl-ACP methyl ester carboxylesterase
VLLHGGGLFDRDETSGANKPFKDLAWGLASRGIAVLRFDKVTHVHSRAASEPGFTATDEYVPAAIAAVRILQRTRGVDPKRVFVLGHSLGGRIAPRVAAADASISGMVILAGDTSPLQKAVVRVARHIAAVSPQSIPAAALAEIESQAARVDDPNLSRATPAADLPFNWSGSYWLDLRDDDPVATAQGLDRPMLILQGARDYQVTVAHDLTGWQSGLADRPNVVIRVYEFDDHLFFRGTGVSTPAGYELPQHVDQDVVNDIANWMLST